MTREPDKYDEHICELLANHDFKAGVRPAWFEGDRLFQFCSFSGFTESDGCGCLTMVKRSSKASHVEGRTGFRDDLTALIQADSRLPTCWDEIEPHHLEVFAEWQRILDREIRNG